MIVQFAAGETIFSEGDPGTHCFQILSGEVEIRLMRRGALHQGASEIVARLGPGEVFGEMCIVDEGPRSASAVATQDTSCKSYLADEVLDVLAEDPAEALNLIRTLVQRLRAANRKIARSG